MSGLRVFYHDAYLAVTDFQHYPQATRRPLRSTLIYLLYLSTHVAVVLTVIGALRWGPGFDDFVQWARENLPPLEVHDGRLHVPAPQPLERYYQGVVSLRFIFDTSAAPVTPDSSEEPLLFFSRDQVQFIHEEQTRTYDWKEAGDFNLGPTEFEQVVRWIRWGYFPTAYSLLLIYKLASFSLTALFLSLIPLSVVGRGSPRLSPRRGFSICLYALTPAVVIDLARSALGQDVPYFLLIYLGIGVVYTVMGTQKVLQAPDE